jgi:hypothetical protein
MLTGLCAFAGLFVWLLLRPEILSTYHYNQYVVAATHLAVLGWISSIVMGATYQLVPVALETHLYSKRLVAVQYAIHLVGFVGMVWMFARWDLKQVGHFGSAFAVGGALFAWNLVGTIIKARRWNLSAFAIVSALAWLGLAATAGLIVAAGKCSYESTASAAPGWLGETLRVLRGIGSLAGRFDQFAVMHAHAHLGIVGVFITLIVGISYKLIPMFTLSEVQHPRRAWASLLLLAAGLGGLFFALLLRSPWKPLFAAFVAMALILYGLELRAILQARQRKHLDLGLKAFLLALVFLAPVGLLGIVLSWPTLPLNAFTGQLENLYGAFGILGVVSLAILGMLYKIIPFLTWYAAYGKHIGKSRVPNLADLYSEPLQAVSLGAYLAGLLTLVPAILLASGLIVRGAAVLLLVGVLLSLLNFGLVLRHLWSPRLQPLILPRRAEASA